ncbi:hypothetical protein EDC96DRAFT_190279 [Choanephora cucurbitarum]|nr:hypothetical protein EDC96DRAFT_190279 [Choanephora cucurbitarum]
MVSFEVKWGTQKLSIELSQEEFDSLTVNDLRLRCQAWTEIDSRFIKLLAHGAILKDDKMLLKNYKITHGSKILIMGSKNHIPPSNTQPQPDAPVSVRLLWLRNRRESVLKPDIQRYQKQVEEHSIGGDNPERTKKLTMYGKYIHEQLMHMMYQLDAMTQISDTERAERKKNVQETEFLLDLIDSIQQKLK